MEGSSDAVDGHPAADGGRPLGRLLVLAGLTGFAISQPLLAVLGESPTLFTFNNVTGWPVLGVALGIAVLPPLVLWGAGLAIAAVHQRAGDWYQLGLVALLSGLAAIQVVKEIGLERRALVALAAGAVAIALALAYHRYRATATWLRFTAPLPLVALILFAMSPTGDLLRTPGTPTAEAAPGDLPPVVFIMLDELPTLSLLDDDEEIDAVRFPHLAAFAEDATWYRHYTALAPFTTTSVPSILSGKDPTDEAPLWTRHPDTLFSLLAASHELYAFETLTFLCGSTDCTSDADGVAGAAAEPRLGDLLGRTLDLWRERVALGTDQATILDDFEEELARNPNELTDAGELLDLDAIQNRPARLDAFVEGFHQGTDRPGFHYLHLMLPHHPWRFYADGRLYEPQVVPGVPQLYPFSYDNHFGPWVSALTEQRHLLQAQYTDRLVGTILEELREAGIYDETLIVITADHGASFAEGTPLRETAEGSIGPIAYVPLLVKAPGQQEGLIDDQNLLAVDLVPTLADLLGVEVPWETDGHPAGSPGIAERGRAKYFFDYRGTMDTGRELHEVVAFDDRELPHAQDRWIGSIAPDDPPTAGLLRLLGVEPWLGTAIDELLTGSGGSAEVVALDRLRRPEGSAPPGIVSGRVTDGPDEGVLLVAVDDVLVSASPLYEDDGVTGYFAAMLPAGTLGERNEIRLALATRDGRLELELSAT